jgi:predicted SprT family Zn-dependent metalloprotease
VKEKADLIRPAPQRLLKLRTRGKYSDLRAVCDKLNRELFNGELDVPITWGRPFAGRRRRQITFGCVDPDNGVIRINPSLDAAFVPEFFVEYIVFHEMLHCLIETRLSPEGRVLAHHGDFKRREREFPRYRDALRWQKKNLHRFMGKAR